MIDFSKLGEALDLGRKFMASIERLEQRMESIEKELTILRKTIEEMRVENQSLIPVRKVG